jgi:hypothetical protein
MSWQPVILTGTHKPSKGDSQLTSFIKFQYLGVTAIVLLLLAWAGPLSAQTFRGSISGSVVDPSDAVVSNVQVVATN